MGPPAAPGAYGEELLARLAALCEADPSREACGFVVLRGGALEVVPIPNAADRFHEEDPHAFPRTSRDGYVMEPQALFRAHRELERTGGRIVAVWHSHVEADARLSERDRADALLDGIPVVPGADYLVLAVHGGRVDGVRCYRFQDGDFVESALR
jgi:proteasome lid subunit RPN8/RPN11